eukprot:CAMPEP_0177630106 /NCGR_PEP_ID=MMETSP0447-20121125/1031_1 /TAXON_ID=0 /ORGANISM="Stygamoeba regulata, Strain BSH-02190019" /LENGTH=355 /DNA_ID=CAMNT_0019131485 /DNA_START=59 /DNA_END=1123 /DNA_ORIENTATION=+
MMGSRRVCALVFLAVVVTCVQACGITTHIEASHRGRDFFASLPGGLPADTIAQYKQILEKYEAYLEAGSPFPDWGFAPSCGAIHDVGEATHQLAFIQAGVKHVHTKYGTDPAKWTSATHALIVFLFGATSHQVADDNWHSLGGVKQGFLKAMGATNFHGDGLGRAQAVGDNMDDAAVLFEMSMKWERTIGNWLLPLTDLAEIYDTYIPQYNLTKTAILKCTTMLFLGRLGERLAIAHAWLANDNLKFSAVNSPFLADNFDTYFQGGMTDMAQWTSLQWHQVATMLQNATVACSPGSTVQVQCEGSGSPPADRYTPTPTTGRQAGAGVGAAATTVVEPGPGLLTELHLRRQRAVDR